MNDYRSERCCRAICASIAEKIGLHEYLVTGGGYQDSAGGFQPVDSMTAEMLEVTPCQNAKFILESNAVSLAMSERHSLDDGELTVQVTAEVHLYGMYAECMSHQVLPREMK